MYYGTISSDVLFEVKESHPHIRNEDLIHMFNPYLTTIEGCASSKNILKVELTDDHEQGDPLYYLKRGYLEESDNIVDLDLSATVMEYIDELQNLITPEFLSNDLIEIEDYAHNYTYSETEDGIRFPLTKNVYLQVASRIENEVSKYIQTQLESKDTRPDFTEDDTYETLAQSRFW